MLTDTHIKAAIKAGQSRRLIDGQGKGTGRLVLAVKPASGRVIAEWYAQQIIGGKRRLKKLGSYPTMSLAAARERFRDEYAGLIEQRKNIKAQAIKRAGSVGDLFDAYSNFLLHHRKKHKDPARMLKAAAEFFGPTRKANEITTDDITDFVRPIYQRGAKRMADHVRGYIRAAYSWAIRAQNDYRSDTADRRFDLRINPAAGIPTEPKVSGDRWLEVHELRAFVRWLDNYQPIPGKRPVWPHNLICLRLMCMLGQRVTEITMLRAEQYNRFRQCLEWADTKTGRAHVLPLPPLAIKLLESIEPNEHGWYFPSKEQPESPTHYLRVQNITRDYVLRNKLQDFSPRDFRRTFKTLAGFAGLTKMERDLLQNHARGDISSRHYDRYDYLEEKRAAMERWGRWWDEHIEGEPQQVVVTIKGTG